MPTPLRPDTAATASQVSAPATTDGYYAAYVLDPDRNNIEVVNHHRARTAILPADDRRRRGDRPQPARSVRRARRQDKKRPSAIRAGRQGRQGTNEAAPIGPVLRAPAWTKPGLTLRASASLLLAKDRTRRLLLLGER